VYGTVLDHIPNYLPGLRRLTGGAKVRDFRRFAY